MNSNLAIKVKYGDVLRRFTAYCDGGTLDINMNGLRAKILILFNLNPDAHLTLTYVDKDGDIVTLVDDDDLCDAALVQHLNPLRISVLLDPSRTETSNKISHGNNSTSMKSPQVRIQLPSQVSAGVEDAFKSVPEPFFSPLLKLSNDLVSALNEFVEYLSMLDSLTMCQDGAAPSRPESSPAMDSSVIAGLKSSNDTITIPTVMSNANPVDKHVLDNPKDNNDGQTAIPFHVGVTCDGCDTSPIIGSRFKSLVKHDYDLCNTCFAKMGKEGDYTRIDHT